MQVLYIEKSWALESEPNCAVCWLYLFLFTYYIYLTSDSASSFIEFKN